MIAVLEHDASSDASRRVHRMLVHPRVYNDGALCWAERGTFRDADFQLRSYWATNNPDGLLVDGVPLALARVNVTHEVLSDLAVAVFGPERADAVLTIKA